MPELRELYRSRRLSTDDRSVLTAMLLMYFGTVAYGNLFGAFRFSALIGLLLLSAALGVAILSRGGTASMIVLPALGIGLVALVIHVTRGHTETQLSVFAFSAVTIVYRHWLPVISAAAAIAVLIGSFPSMQAWAWGPICFDEPGQALGLEHAAFGAAETAVLIALASRARQDCPSGKKIDQVAQGSSRIERAGSTTQEVDDSVQLATSFNGRISSATAEQIESIRRVNSSAARLGQMPQQNAALIEAPVAAAGSLREQALQRSLAAQTFRFAGQLG